LLRVFGVPVSRQLVSSNLQDQIVNSINSSLPVVLIGLSRQVVVDGYDDSIGFQVHVLDPATGTAFWSAVNGFMVSNPSFLIKEVITLVPHVTINTFDFGTLIYSANSDSFVSGSPPSDLVLRESL